MLTHSVAGAIGWLILLFLTSSVTFAVVVFGVMLRRKILLWDDEWKQTLQDEGISIPDFADGLERTYEKIRSHMRLLGIFLFVVVAIMVWVVYLGMLEKPVLGVPQVANGLWLLTFVILAVLLPAFLNFAVGTYLAETMMLKANSFVLADAKEDFKEKKMKNRIREKAKEYKAQRDAARAKVPEPGGARFGAAAAAPPAAAAAGKPAPGAAAPAAKK
jgi:magnesium-transporting ATPase (P-type)